MSLFVVCIYVILCTDSTSWLMASADVLPRLQQRALQADEIISQLKAQLQQLNSSSAASCMFFSNIWQFVILSLKGLRPNSNSISLAGRKRDRSISTCRDRSSTLSTQPRVESRFSTG